MNTLTTTIAAAAAGLLLLTGCGSSAPKSTPDPSAPKTAPATSGDGSEARIVLPAGSALKLPQEPGSGEDALMMDGVYSLVSDGIVVTARARASQPAVTTDGFDTTATPLEIDQVLAGKPSAEEVTLLAGDPQLALRNGHEYLLVLSPAAESPVPDGYTVGSAVSLLSSNGDGTWSSADESVTVTLDEAREVLQESREHLAGRKRAGEAKLELQVSGTGDQRDATVTGYAQGESLGIKFCLPGKDPTVAPAPQDCDAMVAESLTPETGTQTFALTPPTEIRQNPDQAVPCRGRCLLLVYDLDFPSQVFATAEL